jgi:DNA polymerase zeta
VPVNTYILALRASIDHALATAYRRNPYDGKSVYVGHITLVKGVPFFGYSVGYKIFLKIYMLNPLHMTRFTDLLHQGAIMNRILQPYESHLQYLLQWMCDYNLYGCDYINCAKVQFRGPLPDSDEIDVTMHKWHDASVPDDCIAEQDQYPRQSHCMLEIDVCVQDILNRHELQYRPIHHDFLERSSQMPQNPDDRFVPSMAGLWRDETRRRKLRMGLTDPSSSPFPAEVMVSMSADTRNKDKGGWIHEEEYREIVAGLIEDEKRHGGDIRLDTFVKPAKDQEHIKTAVESIEDLYPDNLASQQISDEDKEQLPISVDEKNNRVSVSSDSIDQGPPETAVEEALVEDDGDDQAQSDTEGQMSLDPLTASLLERSSEGHPSDDLIDEGIELIDPSDDGLSDGSDEISSLHKRPLEQSDEIPSKRQRIMAATLGSLKRVSFRNAIGGDSAQAPDIVIDDGTPRPRKTYQASIKAQGVGGPTTRSFPVVKNSSAPETVLRLSQSSYSNSQEGPKTPGPKHLTVRASQQSPVTPWTHQKTSPMLPSSSSPQAHSEAIAITKQLASCLEHKRLTVYFGHLPPSSMVVESTMMHAGIPPVIYKEAYYSNEKDVPERAREYAGREFKLQSTTLPYLPPFDPSGQSSANAGEYPPVVLDKNKEKAKLRSRSHRCSLRHWEMARPPPSYEAVQTWMHGDKSVSTKIKFGEVDGKQQIPKPSPKRKMPEQLSQIEGPTQKNKHGFKYSQDTKSTSVKHETQYMSIMSLEVHVNSRGSLVPDPAEDEIQCIFYSIQGEENAVTDRPSRGIICLSTEDGIVERIDKQAPVEVEYEEDELDLINRVVDIVRQFDPDILAGYEVHNSSWGYLIERARMKYEYNLCDEISRMKSQSHGRFGKDADRWGFTHTSTIRITGRHMINIWRAMRGELNLLQYTMENVVFHLLHKRIPHYQYSDLTAWYTNSKPRDLAKVLNHFLTRVQLNLDILEANEIVPRTSEQARLLGVDFFAVISRGSQYKVESTMFRIAKPENFILISPSRKQVGQQNALECLPLVMEPQSAFYSSPLLVLDFQSLYPSVMIAYNYCYSTCLGRIVSWRGRNKMGFMDFKREPQLLELVKDYINIAPNGMMYVKPEMRKSLLAKMLGELLETRVMVKSGMKQDKDDRMLQQQTDGAEVVS